MRLQMESALGRAAKAKEERARHAAQMSGKAPMFSRPTSAQLTWEDRLRSADAPGARPRRRPTTAGASAPGRSRATTGASFSFDDQMSRAKARMRLKLKGGSR